MFKQGDANGHSQYDHQNPCPPLRLPILGFVALAVQKAYPPALIIRTSKAMDPVKLTDQPINGSAMDLSQGTATNRAQMIRHTLISSL